MKLSAVTLIAIFLLSMGSSYSYMGKTIAWNCMDTSDCAMGKKCENGKCVSE